MSSIMWATTSVSVSEANSWPLASRAAFEFQPVLDDSVVDDDDLSGAIAMGMGIDGVGHPVGGPAGVPNARGAWRERVLGQRSFQVGDATNLFDDGDAFVFLDRHPGRVITPILESSQAGDEKFNRRARPDVSNDATHENVLS